MTRLSLLATVATTLSLTLPAFAQDTDINEGVSYYIGFASAMQMQSNGIEIDREKFIEGLSDAVAGNESKITDVEIQALFERLKASQIETLTAEGRAYLTENGAKDGVTTTASGLQYSVIKAGDGSAKPAATDNVTVHYTGKLLDGTVFDSSVERGQPASFGLNQVIPGWTEGVQLMSVGDTFEFTIPYDLAYGESGAGEDIPGFATLIFEVELISIN